MKTISINNASVHVLNCDWSVHGLVSLALGSEEFSIEHEQDADYGRLNILTLNDDYYAHVREINEDQIETEDLGDRHGLAFVKTVDENYRDSDGDDVVRYWKVEVFDEHEGKLHVFALPTDEDGVFDRKTLVGFAETEEEAAALCAEEGFTVIFPDKGGCFATYGSGEAPHIFGYEADGRGAIGITVYPNAGDLFDFEAA